MKSHILALIASLLSLILGFGIGVFTIVLYLFLYADRVWFLTGPAPFDALGGGPFTAILTLLFCCCSGLIGGAILALLLKIYIKNKKN